MLKIDAKVLEEGERVHLIFKDENIPKLTLNLTISQLGEFIRDLQHLANRAFQKRRNAGKPPTTGAKPRTDPFEVHSIQVRPTSSGMSVSLQVSGKEGQTAHLNIPTVLASALSDQIVKTLATSSVTRQ